MADPKRLADVVDSDEVEHPDLLAIQRGLSPMPALVLMRRAILERTGGADALARWREQHPEQAAHEDRALEIAARSVAAPDEGPNTPVPSEEIRRRMLASGAPPERVADWARPRGAPADRFVAEWLADLEAGECPHLLVLTGSAGAGKTVAALDALAWALREKSRGPTRYENVEALLNLGRWGEDGPKWDRATEAGTLLLDEFKAVERGYRFERVEALLCRRYDSGRPTVITSNLTPQIIRDKRGPFGERVASRLGDERACRIAECGTEDRRRTR